ncbi:MAG: DUF167 domain-containing protein [Rhodobacterales bacterium]|nr:DUF167 domain-containing protein [Rhodobacterales bacterium]
MAPRNDIPDLTALATPGAQIALRVTPKAASNRLTCEDGQIRAWVTTVPEDGKATAAVVRLLARALGVAPTRLTLLKGATSRDKLFRLD